MSSEITTERWGKIWFWWAAGAVCFLILLGAGRLYYPAYRQQQLITQLTARGFIFKPRTIIGDWRRAWVEHAWLPKSWQDAFRNELIVRNSGGACTAEDTALLNELLSLDTDGLHAPPRCRLTLNLKNATDRDLAQLPSNISALDVSSSEITDAGLIALRNMPHLDYLQLDVKHVGDQGLAHLVGLTELTSLRIKGEHISDAGLIHLRGLMKIDFLRLTNTRISDAGLTHLSGLTKLEHLDLSGAQITGHGLAHLTKLSGLLTLNLTGNPIDDLGLIPVERITSLNWLSLHKTKVTVDCYKSLAKLPDLNAVELSDSQVTMAELVDHQYVPVALLKMMQQGIHAPSPNVVGNRDTWLLKRRKSVAPTPALPKK